MVSGAGFFTHFLEGYGIFCVSPTIGYLRKTFQTKIVWESFQYCCCYIVRLIELGAYLSFFY